MDGGCREAEGVKRNGTQDGKRQIAGSFWRPSGIVVSRSHVSPVLLARWTCDQRRTETSLLTEQLRSSVTMQDTLEHCGDGGGGD